MKFLTMFKGNELVSLINKDAFYILKTTIVGLDTLGVFVSLVLGLLYKSYFLVMIPLIFLTLYDMALSGEDYSCEGCSVSEKTYDELIDFYDEKRIVCNECKSKSMVLVPYPRLIIEHATLIVFRFFIILALLFIKITWLFFVFSIIAIIIKIAVIHECSSPMYYCLNCKNIAKAKEDKHV